MDSQNPISILIVGTQHSDTLQVLNLLSSDVFTIQANTSTTRTFKFKLSDKDVTVTQLSSNKEDVMKYFSTREKHSHNVVIHCIRMGRMSGDEINLSDLISEEFDAHRGIDLRDAKNEDIMSDCSVTDD